MSKYGWVRRSGLVLNLSTGDAVLTASQAAKLKQVGVITTQKTAGKVRASSRRYGVRDRRFRGKR